jgi:hypothetical protein
MAHPELRSPARPGEDPYRPTRRQDVLEELPGHRLPDQVLQVVRKLAGIALGRPALRRDGQKDKAVMAEEGPKLSPRRSSTYWSQTAERVGPCNATRCLGKAHAYRYALVAFRFLKADYPISGSRPC